MNLLNKVESDLKVVLEKITNYKISLATISGSKLSQTQNQPQPQGQKKVYTCDVEECRHTFDKAKNLRRHKLRAHGEKKFECENYYRKDGTPCLAKFAEKYALYRHIKKHEEHQDIKEADDAGDS